MNRVSKNTTYLVDRIAAVIRPPEAVVISGFWRSGTTWLQQLTAQAIQAKTIFEPLDQGSFIPYLRGKSVQHCGYIPASAAEFSAADWHSLDLAFRGVSPHRSGFCYLCRNDVSDALLPRTVVKFVRAQMVLGDLISRYQPSATLHISRHPMPVVQSMLKAKWNWSFDDIDLTSWYGKGDPGGLAQLAQAPLRQPHQKVAALWALTEQAALSAQSVTQCRYEDLVAAPESAFPQVLEVAGLAQIRASDFSKDSPVTEEQRKGISTEKRLTSWRHAMPQEIQADIRAVLSDFWPNINETWELT